MSKIGKNILIFGSSKGGSVALARYGRRRCALGFCDNERSKSGSTFQGLEVWHPSDLRIESGEAYLPEGRKIDTILVASQYQDEIGNQLTRLGISSNRIFYVPMRILAGITWWQALRNRLNTEEGMLGCSWKCIAAVAYPMRAIFENPYTLLVTLWNSRVLFSGGIREYSLFSAPHGANQLYYWGIAEKLQKNGLKGVSNSVTEKPFHMSRWWYHTRFSLFLQRRYTALVPLFGMFVWLLSHLVWSGETYGVSLGVAMTVAAFSTTFFANAFCLQNYNVLGWIFVPLILWALYSEYWLLATAFWLGASVCSVTVVFVGGFLCLGFSLVHLSVVPAITIIPAVIKIGIQLLVSVGKNGFVQAVMHLFQSIGVKKQAVKYRRTKAQFLEKRNLYELVLHSVFGLMLFYSANPLLILWLVTSLLVFGNRFKMRFADIQSMFVLVLSVGTCCVITTGDFRLAVVFWLLLSVPPAYSGLATFKDSWYRLCPRKPFKVGSVISRMDDFISPVDESGRVFMAFDDPKNRFDSVFDGYRWLVELVSWSCHKRDILFFPNWFAVFDHNDENDPGFWGREPKVALANARRFSMDFVIAYESRGEQISPDWIGYGCEALGSLDFDSMKMHWEGERLYAKPGLKWHLFRVPQSEPET